MNKREQMVNEIRQRYSLESPKVLSVMLQIPREMFAPKRHRLTAYSDGPVPIGYGQTMSQPYTVAFMTHLLNLKGREKVLEVGTGSGYQAAVLSRLAKEVYTVEIIDALAKKAERVLKKLGYGNVLVRSGTGEFGWEEKAPFDAILVTAGLGREVPEGLFNQLRDGGVLVAPVGVGYDKVMIKYSKLKKGKIKKHKYGIFHFVPFIEKKH